ncbi:MAG: hypothetical protein LBE49_00645 [Deltaproteobacteria bacterium]|jgi:putative RNA 2'-phosphotransferase|nr:hypothetical protein [Deltaproteobacteria bacterium]
MSNLKLSRQVESLEKLLVYALGVAPWEFGLMAGQDGWLPIKEVVAAIRGEDGFRGVTEGRILEIHRRPGGQSPLEMDEARIRLKPEKMKLEDRGERPAKPPKILFLPVKASSWPHVAANGQKAKPEKLGLMLFEERERALKTFGRLYPDPVLAEVSVQKASSGRGELSWYAPGLWYSPELKPEWLSGPPTPPKTEAEPARKPEAELPGAPIWAEPAAPPSKGKKKGKYEDAPEWKTRTRMDRRKGQG